MRRRTLDPYAVLLLAVAACTGGADDAPPDSVASGDAAPAGVYGQATAQLEGIPTVVELHGPSVPPIDPAQVSPVVDQLGLDFHPRRIFVPVGDTILFTNSETVTHNVRIMRIEDGEELLDAEQDPGQSTSLVVEREGGYEVLCDHHAGMRAFIYATSTPHAAFAEPDGSYVVPDVPEGSYTISTWTVDPDLRVERTVEVSGESTQVDLTP